MIGRKRIRRWATLVLLAGLLGAAISGCVPLQETGGHSGAAGQHSSHH
ncbi:hypothetical protein DSOUD_1861 [Desulfuromonas soudanensis]|uniref:Lipoprotein n=1 Tax=Desulfuromonas soudanensis TaxID=1603606 RepID=A0A0M3QFT6_9BACT|nr:hypothetical protein [Desulfuromonas soudanensis]ALC16633.1 hypothetical protein DSOUD_1861 [Desulfuromonas soudanensis]